MKVEPIDKSRLAKTDQELRDLAASDADWIVRTADDVRELREVGDNVFAKLPENEFGAFLATLRFEMAGSPVGPTSRLCIPSHCRKFSRCSRTLA